MQDLMIEMGDLRNTLSIAITELKRRGRDKAKAEQDYRVALAKEMLIQRDAGQPVTIIGDICRGKAEIAKLKFERDFAETLYTTCMQKIYQCKIEMGIIENQINAERKGE